METPDPGTADAPRPRRSLRELRKRPRKPQTTAGVSRHDAGGAEAPSMEVAAPRHALHNARALCELANLGPAFGRPAARSPSAGTPLRTWPRACAARALEDQSGGSIGYSLRTKPTQPNLGPADKARMGDHREKKPDPKQPEPTSARRRNSSRHCRRRGGWARDPVIRRGRLTVRQAHGSEEQQRSVGEPRDELLAAADRDLHGNLSSSIERFRGD